MKHIKHMSILWISLQIFVNELKLKWTMCKHHKSEKEAQRCLKELQSKQMTDDDFDDFDEWIPLIRAMNPEIPENVFLGEQK